MIKGNSQVLLSSFRETTIDKILLNLWWSIVNFIERFYHYKIITKFFIQGFSTIPDNIEAKTSIIDDIVLVRLKKLL